MGIRHAPVNDPADRGRKTAPAHHRRHEEFYPTISQKELPTGGGHGGREIQNGAEAKEASCGEIATEQRSVLSGQLVMARSWLIAGDAQCGLSCARSLEKILRLPRTFGDWAVT